MRVDRSMRFAGPSCLQEHTLAVFSLGGCPTLGLKRVAWAASPSATLLLSAARGDVRDARPCLVFASCGCTKAPSALSLYVTWVTEHPKGSTRGSCTPACLPMSSALSALLRSLRCDAAPRPSALPIFGAPSPFSSPLCFFPQC